MYSAFLFVSPFTMLHSSCNTLTIPTIYSILYSIHPPELPFRAARLEFILALGYSSNIAVQLPSLQALQFSSQRSHRSHFFLKFVFTLFMTIWKNIECASLILKCPLRSEPTSLVLMSVILPALHPAATAAYDAPAALTFLPANRCHATVNLHCAHVTFCKLRCPWSQVINTGRGNWMLIGETIDQSQRK